jgi:hypothetical protein
MGEVGSLSQGDNYYPTSTAISQHQNIIELHESVLSFTLTASFKELKSHFLKLQDFMVFYLIYILYTNGEEGQQEGLLCQREYLQARRINE